MSLVFPAQTGARSPKYIAFNKPSITELEIDFARRCLASGEIRAGGPFSRKCEEWLEERLNRAPVMLTSSATAGLEIAMLLYDVHPGDEVIMPAFTFVSCANAVALRGATPVLVDVNPSTLNIDLAAVRQAVTPRTRGIVAVHYAGVPYDSNNLSSLAKDLGLFVIEDAAHAITSRYLGREVGTLGNLSVFSFHHTKNLSCGEGGALVVNDPALLERARAILECGTNSAKFRAGLVNEYSWVDLGSSYRPSELTAAVLAAQFERAEEITEERLAIWTRYHQELRPLDDVGVQRPKPPVGAEHNAHIYFIVLPPTLNRSEFVDSMRRRGIEVAGHYVPLDRSIAGRRFARTSGSLSVTHSIAARLVRLPMWVGLRERQEEVISAVLSQLHA